MLPVRRCDVYHPHAGIAAEAVARGHMKHAGALAQTAAMFANRTNLKRRTFVAVERELLTGQGVSFDSQSGDTGRGAPKPVPVSGKTHRSASTPTCGTQTDPLPMIGPKPPIVLCLSNYVMRDVTAHYPLAPDRLVRLFNAVDLKKFDPTQRPEVRSEIRQRFGLDPDRPVALMIAQDFARKGLREAILAMHELADDRLAMLVVGKEDPAVYQKVARLLGIEKRVIFCGSTSDPFAFYRAADFFVLPTRHDPCSLVVLEALAMGLPVISTAFNGACEIMTDGRHGFVLADPADVGALSGAMRRLLDATARREMSQACLALRPSLAYENHLDQLIAIYSRAQHRQ
jgi:UDP-glucose:(heptosyl)LPS alpha-1,3-glucosyltransferase